LQVSAFKHLDGSFAYCEKTDDIRIPCIADFITHCG
jgi:hypothetical protein